jgi:hypothetical protein
MSGLLSNSLFLSTAAAAGGLQISRSLRFNSSDSGYCARTPGTASNRKTWTWSGWVKRSVLGSTQAFFGLFFASNDASQINIQFDTTDNIRFNLWSDTVLRTTQVFRDCSAWYHFVIAFDAPQGTASNRLKIYVNGAEITTFSTDNRSSLLSNQDYAVNAAQAHYIGYNNVSSQYFNGYLTNIHFIDGQALTPSSFTETDATTGQLIPKTYTGTYGTNGYNLLFADNSSNTASTLGKDSSGLGNDWTPNNFSVSTGSVATATGALPVFNTTDTYGAVKGTGTRTDTNSSYISLALPMDGTNGGTSFGDQSAVIRGSGSAKTVTVNGNTNTSTAVSKFYGSSGKFDGSGDYLTIASSADLTVGTGAFTAESWIYPLSQSNAILFQNYDNGNGGWSLRIQDLGGSVNGVSSIGPVIGFTSGTLPTSSWSHVAAVWSATGSNCSVYINGVLARTISNIPSTAQDTFWIGAQGDQGPGNFFNGYIQDLRIYKGVAKYTSAFSVPAMSTGAGNDSLVDSPTNYGTDTGVGSEVRGNYATLNNLKSSYTGGTVTVSNGNLDFSANMTANQIISPATIGVSSGKWYWEITCNSITKQYGFDGAVGISSNGDIDNGTSTPSIVRWYVDDGLFYNGSSGAAYGASWQAGDIIGVALNLDAGTLSFYKNNSSQGQATSGLTGTWFPVVASNNVVSFTANFGQRAFAYTAPSGFKALCTQNLPAPLVTKSNTVFDVALYTGNGSTQTISGLGFSPDLVWIKNRTSSYNHGLWDTVRGATNALYSSLTNAEGTESGVSAFNSDGFSVGSSLGFNKSSDAIVGWAWDAGTTTVSNTQGSITSQVRANATAGFSVVTYTGPGPSNNTVGHGLGVAPELIITKNRDRSIYWVVYTKTTGKDAFLRLNTTDASTAAGSIWGTAAPTSTVFGGVGTDLSNGYVAGEKIVSYCFAPVVGYSNGFSYTGNGSADGSFVYLGFRPRLIMLKRSDSTSNWTLLDTSREGYNVDNDPLYPNTSAAEGTADLVDITSNGFKLRTTDASVNASAGTYIGFAWAEMPFNYSRAR